MATIIIRLSWEELRHNFKINPASAKQIGIVKNVTHYIYKFKG